MKRTESQASLRSSALTSSQFALQTQIGTGSFGTVFHAIHRSSGRECAVKRIDLESSDDDIEEIQKEIAILAECNDDHITRYYGCFMHEFELWIVMEYLGGGSCLDLLKDLRPSTLPEAAIAEVIANVVDGLAYLHGTGKIHRDIKAANVLLSESAAVKIADFGVAAQLSNNLSRRNTFVGTPFWMAPEVIDQLEYSFSADVWSLGITAIELAVGKPPWSHLHPMKALFTIPRSEPPRLDSRFSPEFRDFVSQCLRRDPRDRASVVRLQSHAFLAKRNRQALLQLIHQRLPPALAEPISSLRLGKSPSKTRPDKLSDGSVTLTQRGSPDAITKSGSDRSATSRRRSRSRSRTRSSSNSSRSGAGGNGSSSGSGSHEGTAAARHESSTDSQRTVYSIPSDPGDDGSDRASSSASTHQTATEDDDDDWDFDTVKPQPSLEQILANPPASAHLPKPIPEGPPPSSQQVGYRTVDSLKGTLGHTGSQSLVRIFGHASRKFGDPILGEIADLLRTDPPTIGVEGYLVKRIGRLAVQNFDLKTKGKTPGFDAVEQILMDKWREEVVEAQATVSPADASSTRSSPTKPSSNKHRHLHSAS